MSTEVFALPRQRVRWTPVDVLLLAAIVLVAGASPLIWLLLA